MIIGTKELEDTQNVVRIPNGAGYEEYNFYKLQYVKTEIVQGVTASIPNTTPTLNQVNLANKGLDTDNETYCSNYFPYDPDWQNNESFICYESNRDIMNAAGANVARLHSQVDVYRIVQSTNNAY
jgi:hypothetical protein